jgi:tRNA A-37 threonylcarbamoyl transferase component Bud32
MPGPELHPLQTELLNRWRAAPHPRDQRLRALLTAALAGGGQLLRLSPRRMALRLELQGEAWLLKLDAPQRPFEALRRVLRAGPVRREARNAERLAAEISGSPMPALAEENRAGWGLYARPWIEGANAAAELVEQAELIGAGLARLHMAGWTDPDLTAADLILPAGGTLLPLDLGHARVQRRGAVSAERRLADFVKLLASVAAERASAAAPGLVEGYARLVPAPAKARDLLQQAGALRRQLLHRQSRRCLRACRDFSESNGVVQRRGDMSGRVVEFNLASAKAARAAFRALYELELHGLRALRPEQYGPGAQLRGSLPPSRPATAADDEAVLDLSADFLRAGFALDLEEPLRFAADADGRAWLADPAALLGRLRAKS